MSKRRFTLVLVVLYVAAAILIGRASVTQNVPPFSLADYSLGRAPMPYQARYLMVPAMRWAGESVWMQRAAQAFSNSARGPRELLLQGVNSICMVGLGWLTVSIRRKFTPPPMWMWLAPGLLLWVVSITYVVRYDQRLFLPYDFLSILLFNVGVAACLDGRAWLLLATMVVGTYNRETTVFLLPLWMALQWRSDRRSTIWAVAGLAVWIAVKFHLRSLVHGASAGLQFNWNWNVAAIVWPHHWAQLLSVGGYLALPLWLRRSLARDERLRLAWIGCLPFVVGTLIFGVWNETRIFGEFSVLIAVTAAVAFEQHVREEKGLLVESS